MECVRPEVYGPRGETAHGASRLPATRDIRRRLKLFPGPRNLMEGDTREEELRGGHPVVSVILATYNGAQYLDQAIRSVLAQTFEDFELIVVDDGSTDPQVRAICDRYSGRLRYIFQKNRGLAGARNTGIRHSQGEFICFIDDDDMWKPEKLARQVAFIRNSCPEDNVGMVSTWLELIDHAGRPIGRQGHNLRGDTYRELLLGSPVDAPSSVMVRREVFNRVGLHDESLRHAEDRDMWLRIARHFQIRSLNEYLVYYRVRPGSQSRNAEAQLRCVEIALKKAFDAAGDSADVQTMKPRAMASLYFHWSLSRFFAGDAPGCRERFRLADQIDSGSGRPVHRVVYLASYLGSAMIRALLSVYRWLKSRVRQRARSVVSVGRNASTDDRRLSTAARVLPRSVRVARAAARELVFLVRLVLSFVLVPVWKVLPPKLGIALCNVLWFGPRRTSLDTLELYYEYDKAIDPYLAVLDPALWLRDRCVVDFGAGSSGKAISCVREGARLVIALEIDGHRLTEAGVLAKSHLVGDEHRRLALVRGSVYEAPLRGAVADTIISYTVFEHLSRPRDALAEAFRVLRPGGHMLLYYHYFCSPYGAHLIAHVRFPWPTLFFREADLIRYFSRRLQEDQARGLCQATFRPDSSLSRSDHDHFMSLNRLAPAAFEALLAEQGLEIVKAGYYGPRRAVTWLGRLNRVWKPYAHDGKYYVLRKPDEDPS